ncbi:MAG: BlaI/MecI/CopY family transcriptional regulator [Eubacterium sp.]|nr:BlaI/MecI/CopY family transcriptional regulator [Eubacterium sp.]
MSNSQEMHCILRKLVANSKFAPWKGMIKYMKRLPESELEIMMIIWKYNRPVNRMEIEKHLKKEVAAPTILSFLNRLEAKGFVSVEKVGKINWYTPLVKEDEYLQKESRNILQKMYQNSLKNFVTALYDGDGLSAQDIEDLKSFIEEKSAGV